MSKTNNTPATSYSNWCYEHRDAVRTLGRNVTIAYGPETYDAWAAGQTPVEYVGSLPYKVWNKAAGRWDVVSK